MSTSLSRFNVSHGCPAHPGRCAVCGSSEGRMIDFGLDLDFYGVVYLCELNCIKELFNVLGYYSPEQVESIKSQFEELIEAQKQLVAHNRELEDALDSLTKLRLTPPTAYSGPVDLAVLDVSKEDEQSDDANNGESTDSIRPVSEGDSKQPETGNTKSRRNKSRSSQQNDGAGSSGVHHDDSIESFGL